MEKRKGVIVGASEDAVHTIEVAKKQGIYVIALDGNSRAAGFQYSDESIVVDISDKDKVCEVIDRIEPDFLIPVPIGRYLSTMGYINEKYQLKGIKYAPTEYSTDKYLFHKKLKTAGLRKIRAFLINEKTDIEKIKTPYPVIMKPRFGSGSRDIFYIADEEELIKIYNELKNKKEDFVLEQVVQGMEYSIDGAVVDKQLQITLLRKKTNTPLPIRQVVSNFSVVKAKENEMLIARVLVHLQKVVAELDYNDCLLHADLIINGSHIFVIEIAPRPSGHNLHNVFVPQATGIDIAEQYQKFLLGREFRFVSEKIRCMQIRYFDFEDVIIKKVPEEAEIRKSNVCNLIQWQCNIQAGDVMGKVTDGHSIMGRGFFIVEGKDERDLVKQSTKVLTMFEVDKLSN